VWLNLDGSVMLPEDWDEDLARAIGVVYNGDGIGDNDDLGNPITDVSFLVIFNSNDGAVTFTLPPAEYADTWEQVIDTAARRTDLRIFGADGTVGLAAKSVVVLRASTPAAAQEDYSVEASLAAASRSDPEGQGLNNGV
jgi:isoamylase